MPRGIRESVHARHSTQLDAALAHADANIDQASSGCTTLLRIKSISTDPAYAERVPARRRLAGRRSHRRGLRRRRRARPPATRWSSRTTSAPTARTCCSTATTTCSRSIRSNCGTPIRSSRSCVKQPDGETHHRRPRRLRRQGPAADLRRGLPRLEGRHRRACRSRSRCASRARRRCGGTSLPPFLDRPPDELARRHRAGLRHRHVGPRDALDHHHAARPRRRGDRDHLRRQGPPFRHVRQRRAQPQPGAGRDHRQPAQPRRQRRGRRLLRRRRRSCPPTSPRSWKTLGFDEAAFLGERRPLDPGRRSRTARCSSRSGRARPARSTA